VNAKKGKCKDSNSKQKKMFFVQNRHEHLKYTNRLQEYRPKSAFTVRPAY